MCGIVGLLLKKPALREPLGALMTPMLLRTISARTGPRNRARASDQRALQASSVPLLQNRVDSPTSTSAPSPQ